MSEVNPPNLRSRLRSLAGPAPWLVGWQPLTPLLLVLPFLLSGVIRALTGLSLSLALIPAVLLSAALGWRALVSGGFRSSNLAQAWAAAALFAGGAIATLYAIPFDGLVTVGGGDAGNHVFYAHQFSEREPRAYHGFIGFHSIAAWLERLLGFSSFQSFRAVFYLLPICFGLTVATLNVAGSGGRRRPLRWAVAGLALLVLGWRWLFPLFHYQQADGYYAHLFAINVLIATVTLFALSESPLLRIGIWIPAAVVYRFSYGLNLGDFLAASAVLVVVEAARVRTRWSAWPVLILGAAAGLVAAGFAYYRLAALIPLQSAVVYPTLHQIIRGELFLVLSIGLAPWIARRTGVALEPIAERAFHAAAAFGAVNCGVQLACRWAGLPSEYYFVKYHLHGVTLLALVVIALLIPWLATLARETLHQTVATKQRLARVGGTLALSILLGIGLFNLDRGYAAYRVPFAERLRPVPPFRHIGPLADLDGWGKIEQALIRHSARFGGLLAPSWPLMNFMNAGLRFEFDERLVDPGWDLYINGRLDLRPGRCVFWYGAEADYRAYLATPEAEGRRAAVARELQTGPSECEEYPARWNPAEKRRLCFRCFPADLAAMTR